jgi:hypothetical protein
MVDSEPSDFLSDSGDKVPGMIEVSSDSDVKEFVEFEPVLDIVGPGKMEFEDLCKGQDPYLFIRDLEIESDSN